MPTLSNGNNILSGKYTEDMKIKVCNNCGCYSPVLADTCCWCGSEDLTIIDGAKEVKREQTELAETTANNTKKNAIMALGGIGLMGIGLLVMCSNMSSINITMVFGAMIVILGAILDLLGATKSLNKKVIIKYGNIDNFLNGISKQLSNQRNFTSDNNLVPRYAEMRKTLNNNFNTKMSKQDFIKLLNIWFEGYISPEIIQIRINKYLEENKYKQDKEIASITEDFYNARKKMTNSISQSVNNILNNESKQISNIQTTGLNYGIITNSVSNAVLYDAMNNKAHRNQYNIQLNPILKNTNTQLNSIGRSMTTRDEQIYINFKEKMMRYVKQKLNAES